MKIEQGDKIKFALPIDINEFKILIGKVLEVYHETNQVKIEYCKNHFENEYQNVLVKKENVIEQVDINRTGYPIEWINDFVYSEYREPMLEVFLNGRCYLFQEWLSKRLFNSKIVYIKEKHHYVVDYYGRLFDIRGEVTDRYIECTKDIHRFEGDWNLNR